jgi:antitoxin (DNA-binding transcriptional repressor) of toxin-antitoxin stability system
MCVYTLTNCETIVTVLAEDFMITINVRELKAHWSDIEKKLELGETFQVLNRGRPTAKIVPAEPKKILNWPDHLATAVPNRGKSAAETVLEDRSNR